MDEIQSLTPFLEALGQTISDHQTSLQDGDALNQKFKSLVQEKIASFKDRDCKSHQFANGRVIHLPPRTLNINPSESKVLLEICRPLPDEIIQGWRGRMQAANCISPKEKIEELIAAYARSIDRDATVGADFFEDVACILNMQREQLLKQHTLTTFFNCLSGLKASGKLGTKSPKHREARERHAPFSFGGKHPRYCWQCAQEDRSSLGFSYWRRAHQIPGLLWCAKHSSHLLTVTQRDAFNRGPHEMTDTVVNEKIHDLSNEQTELLKRYVFIANEIFEQMPEIDSRTASITLGKMARIVDLRFSKIGTRSTVSNHIMELLPTWWLEEISRVTWTQNEYISSIDGICSPGATRYTTVTLSFLTALFYEDRELAVSEILKPASLAQSKTLGSTFWGSKKAFDEYVAQKGIVSNVAEQLSIPVSTTSLGLLNQGLPGLGKSTTVINAVHAFLSGASLTDACTNYNATTDEVQAFLRQSGTKLKTALDKIQGKSCQDLQPSIPATKKQISG